MNIVFGRIGPHVEFDHPHTPLEGPNDWGIATITAQLVPSEVGVVACEYEIMWQRSSHVMVYLEQDMQCVKDKPKVGAAKHHTLNNHHWEKKIRPLQMEQLISSA